MSDTPNTGGSPAHELQFDQVEFAEPAASATCGVCSQPMRDVYYEVNGMSFCQGCREQIQHAHTSGSAVGRFIRATLYGSLAGLAGAAIYYGVREATNIEFGLIAVVVGLMIGKAVKTGSKARGGWLYQGLAIFLTYTAIVVTYIPPLVTAIRPQADKEKAAATEKQPAKPAGAVEAPGDAGALPPPNLPEFLLALALLTGFAYALPVMVGFQSPMALLIMGFGLYEAWIINRKVPLIINGPYQLGQRDAGSAVDAEPAG